VKFGMVERMRRQDVDVRSTCKVLGVSRSGFYAWVNRPESERQRANDELLAKIRSVHAESRKVYGSPRVHAALKKDGLGCGKNRIARLMRENHLSGASKKKFRIKTTDSNHNGPIAPRIFKTEEVSKTVSSPNQVWAGDITYIETDEGWLFLAIYIDVFTRKIVGYSMKEKMHAVLVIDALRMAVERQNLTRETLVVHTDRGAQYAASEYRSFLVETGVTPSMSRKGNCYDNAFAETFFKTLKTELVYQRQFKTKKEARSAIFEYVEVFYNRERLHSSLGYQTPEGYEIAI
jgi:putative transposase